MIQKDLNKNQDQEDCFSIHLIILQKEKKILEGLSTVRLGNFRVYVLENCLGI